MNGGHVVPAPPNVVMDYCMDCHEVFGVSAGAPGTDGMLSHGYCPDCKPVAEARMRAEIEALRARRAANGGTK